jgi:hypothetical protein
MFFSSILVVVEKIVPNTLAMLEGHAQYISMG